MSASGGSAASVMASTASGWFKRLLTCKQMLYATVSRCHGSWCADAPANAALHHVLSLSLLLVGCCASATDCPPLPCWLLLLTAQAAYRMVHRCT